MASEIDWDNGIGNMARMKSNNFKRFEKINYQFTKKFEGLRNKISIPPKLHNFSFSN